MTLEELIQEIEEQKGLMPRGHAALRLPQAASGRKLDGRTYDEFPRRVRNPVLAADDCLSLAAKVEGAFKKMDFVECLV